jgi:DNA-binding transcriptional regulator GbsR (MarR family)
MADDPKNQAREAELGVADTIGRLMQFWGFKRPMGRIWTLLYLSPQPLGASEIGSELKMCAGSVSMTLAELLKWGAVRKTWRPGERRDYFEAETSIWKLVGRVLRERELGLVREFSEGLSEAEQALEAVQSSQSSAEPPDEELDQKLSDVAFKRERIQQLFELSKVGEKLLSALVAGEAVDPTPILKASNQ